MAEALWTRLGDGRWTADSAGSHPSGYVHSLAIRAMREVDIDIAEWESKSLERYRDQAFDLVVTVCDNAKESCPVFPGAKQTLHWPFDDPADAAGSDDERMETFRRVRDEIKERIKTYFKVECRD
jgi:arsenate reductase